MVQKSGKLSWGWEVIPLFTRFYTAPRWLAGLLNHQQYFVSNVLMFGYLQFQRLIGVATLAIWPYKRSKSMQIWWVKRSIFIPHLPVPYVCLVVEPTHPKNMLLKLEIFPNSQGENGKSLKPPPRTQCYILLHSEIFRLPIHQTAKWPNSTLVIGESFEDLADGIGLS